jgi:hypothetical protein
MLVLHCSPAGPAREMYIFGQRACRRCTSVASGVVIGSLAGMMCLFKFWTILLALPAAIEALVEKSWTHKFLLRLMTLLNSLAGISIGFVSVMFIQSLGLSLALAMFFCVFIMLYVSTKFQKLFKVD